MPKIRFTDTTSGAKQDADADLPIDAKPYGGSGATLRPKVFRTAAAAVVIPPQVNTLPTIGGGPEVSNVLSLSFDFEGGSTFSYRWLLDGVLSGSSATYTIQSGDQGKTITAEVQAIGAGVSSAWYTAANVVFVPVSALAVVTPEEWDTYEAPADADTRKMFAVVNDSPTAGYEFMFARYATLPPDDVAAASLGAMTFVVDRWEATSSNRAAIGTPSARTIQYIRIAERNIADPSNTGLWRWVSETKSYFASSTPTEPVVSVTQGTGVGEILINITTVADPSGRAVTGYEYRVDGGAWTSLSGLGLGPRSITGFTPLSTYSIEVRAVNANGNGAATAAQTTLAGDPPAPPPAVTNLVFNSQQVTLDGAYTVITHVDGTKCIVSATPVTLLSKTPETVSTLGAVRNGAVKNLKRDTPKPTNPAELYARHAFDTRIGGVNMAVLADFTAGVTLNAGDSIVLSVGTPEGYAVSNRAGHVEAYDMVYVASSAPNPLSLGPAAVGWSGRSGLATPPVIDYLAKAALLPVTYSLTSASYLGTPFAYYTEAQMERALRWNPGFAYAIGTANSSISPGYQGAMPHNWGHYTQNLRGTDNANYGYYMGQKLDAITWHLCAPLSSVSLALKAKILMLLDSFVWQCRQAWEGSGEELGLDGTHYTFHQAAFGIVYWMRDDTAGLDAFYDRHSANWRQFFRFTEDMIPEWFQPWGDPDDFTSMYTLPYPSTMFRRRILAVDSVAKTVTYRPLAAYGPAGARGASTKQRLAGLILTLESNPTVVKARIASGGEGNTLTAGTSDAANRTMTLDTWPTPGFQVDDIVTFNCPWTFAVGDPEWRINSSSPNIYNPGPVMSYRNDHIILTPLAILRVLGVHRESWQTAWEYELKSLLPDFPLPAPDDWPSTRYGLGSLMRTLWETYKTDILAVSQPNIP